MEQDGGWGYCAIMRRLAGFGCNKRTGLLHRRDEMVQSNGFSAHDSGC